MPAPQPCPGCGCEIDSGLLWFAGPGLARICCNKRCASRAQKRHEALATGKARGRKSMPQPPMAYAPVEAEQGWSSLNQDVMAQVAARLGLRDCLAAALTCKHWRTHITRGAPHTSLRIDDVRSSTPDQPQDLSLQHPSDGDVDGASASPSPLPSPAKAAAAASPAPGSGDAAAQLLDSARRLMPHVEHLSVSVYSRCRQHDYLLKHMRALSRWSGLTSLDISWEAAPDAVTGTSITDPDDDEEEEDAQQKQQGKAGRRRSGNGARSCDGGPVRLRRSVFGPLCLGAVGLMRGLRRLSITAAFGRRHTGLFGLAPLEHLTHLELRQAPGERRPIWRTSDAALASLTALRSLAGHGALLGPHLLAAVGPHLTRLDLERWDAAGGYDSDLPGGGEEESVITPGFKTDGAVLLMRALWDMKELRLFRLTLCDPETDVESQAMRTKNLQFVMAGLATRAIREQDEAAAAGRPPVFAEVQLDLNVALAPLRHDGSAGFADGDDDTRRRLQLTEELLETCTFLSRNLTRLAVGFGCGEASSLHRLGQLTRLTRLELRADRDAHVHLTPEGAHALCAGLGASLRSLALDLSAACLGPDVLQSLRLLTALRWLKIMANPHLRQAPLQRGEVERQLLEAAQRQCVGLFGVAEAGGSSSGGALAAAAAVAAVATAAAGAPGAAAGAAAAPSAAVVAEVAAALTPLAFLQELFTAMEDVEGVRQSLEAEAEWRAQHLQEVQRRVASAQEAAAAADEAVVAAQAAALEALAAAGDAVAPDPAASAAMETVETAVALATAAVEEALEVEREALTAAAAPMPHLPHWVLADDAVDGEWDLAAAAALAWILPAEYGDAAAAAPPPPPQPRPLNELSVEELEWVWWYLFRAEWVMGPTFRMGAWLPPQLETLILGGFVGLELPPPPMLPQLRRRPVLPALANMTVGVVHRAEVASTEQLLRELRASGAAPALSKWRVQQVQMQHGPAQD
ncbi:hypothetical protein HXX76_000448 [Chlamydomonas incerta]|uniref:F-box domain-containing protein n=1 Tax=Chlamydomonas incerta TaxID=51695 RepID=A0A835WE52_CHLIN|nr:hypothetical protein HXX76_000448 [Chlamydomonas incerta]|eukprot:KAG2445844.1 hypothetical protein HXX76_000448 [Chlamydomonas incerta]